MEDVELDRPYIFDIYTPSPGIGSLRSVCIRLYARDRGGDCSLEEPLPTAKRNA